MSLDGKGFLATDEKQDGEKQFTWEAFIRVSKDQEDTKILSTSTPGTSDGVTLDLWPNGGPRVGIRHGWSRTDTRPPVDEWVQMAASFDPDNGELALYMDGKRVSLKNFYKKFRVERDSDYVSRAYTLQRYVAAAAGRGNYPIKFNGSIFTWDHRTENKGKVRNNPDYRRWGPAFWFQNTRHMYWPMLASGDFEMMQPFFDMYVEALPVATARTKTYYDHAGGYFPETATFWGTYTDGDYGNEEAREGKEPGWIRNPWIRHYHSGNLELLQMAIDYVNFTGDQEFARNSLLPMADAFIDFYDNHYPRNDDGTIRFEPSQALETYQKAIDPANEIAGLSRVRLFVLARAGQCLRTSSARNDSAVGRRCVSRCPSCRDR